MRNAVKRHWIRVIAVVAWLLAVGFGFWQVTSYSHRIGAASSTPVVWPTQSHLMRDENQATLVVFLHPRCPCSEATISELERVVAHCQDRLTIHTVFEKSTVTEPKTSLKSMAGRLPGNINYHDESGVEGRNFGATTSGYTLLFDKGGHLLFNGGATSERGHAGDNLGSSLLLAAIRKASSSSSLSVNPANTPVFGCPLFHSPTNALKAAIL